MEPNVTEAHLEVGRKPPVRILALVPIEMQGRVRRQLATLDVVIDFGTKVG